MDDLVRALDNVVKAGKNIVKGDVLKDFYKTLDDKIPHNFSGTGDLLKDFTQIYFKVDNDLVKFEPVGTIKTIDDYKFAIRNGKFFDMYKDLVQKGKISKHAGITGDSFKPIQELFQKTFPDHSYNRIMVDDLNKVKSHFGDTVTNTAPARMEDLADLYHTNTKFKKFIDELAERPKSEVRTFLCKVLIGGGVVALLAALYQLSQDMAGCWRYYQDDNGQTLSCKISQASCKYPHVVNQCSQIPEVIRNANPGVCQGWDEGKENSACRKCDPNAKTDSPQYLDAKDFVKPSDMYRCRGPGTIGEMAANIIHIIPNIIHDGGDIIVHIFSILKYAVIGAIIIIIVVIFYKAYNLLIGYKSNQYPTQEPPPYSEKIVN